MQRKPGALCAGHRARIAWVFQRTVEQLAEVHVEIAQKRVEPIDVGQRDAEVAATLARIAAALTADGLVSVAGGGDTVAALNHAHAADGFTFVSNAGGAFLEWMEGKPLPGVTALERSGSLGG